MSSYLMLDLETLDTRSSSIVLSIGACVFNDNKLNTEQELRSNFFYEELSISEQEKNGRTISTSTLAWWLNQPDPGLKKFFNNKKSNITNSLENFHYFILNNNSKIEGIWSNGPSFDMNIIESLYNSFNKTFCMDFRKWFDFRTAKLVRNLLKIPENSFTGTRHNALDDAINQALSVNQILYYLTTNNINYPKMNVNKPEPISRKRNLEIDDSEYIGPRIEDLDLIIDMND